MFVPFYTLTRNGWEYHFSKIISTLGTVKLLNFSHSGSGLFLLWFYFCWSLRRLRLFSCVYWLFISDCSSVSAIIYSWLSYYYWVVVLYIFWIHLIYIYKQYFLPVYVLPLDCLNVSLISESFKFYKIQLKFSFMASAFCVFFKIFAYLKLGMIFCCVSSRSFIVFTFQFRPMIYSELILGYDVRWIKIHFFLPYGYPAILAP